MPTADQILAGLGAIANQWWWLASAWHLYFALILVVVVAGWRPGVAGMGALLAAPLLSVSVMAWVYGNPFNGTLFALVGVASFGIAVRRPPGRISLVSGWPAVAGALMFAFGWVYPHFLDASSWLVYLYAAPTGLIPCPTLSAVIGLGLLFGGLGSRAWSLLLVAAGLFYALFGALRLGVSLDWVLLAGSLALAVQAVAARQGPS